MTKPETMSNRRGDGTPIEHDHGGRRWWWRPYVVGAALATAALLMMIWQIVVRGPFVAVDWPIHDYFAPVTDSTAKDVRDWLSRPGQRWFTLPVLLAAGAFVSWRQRRLRPLIAVIVGLGTAFLLGKWAKEGLGRTAPFMELDILHGSGEAFPSGHVANATYTWALITLLFFGTRGLWPNRRRVYLGFAVTAGLVVLVSTIMVINDYHWLTDVPGGIAIGLIALMAALLAWGPAVPVDVLSADSQSPLTSAGRDLDDQTEVGVAPAAPEPLSRESAAAIRPRTGDE
jgi:membrane-associated phospholipid phosphatase